MEWTLMLNPDFPGSTGRQKLVVECYGLISSSRSDHKVLRKKAVVSATSHIF